MSSSRALPSKYARTLFEVVPDADRPRVADDLEAFASLVASHADLTATFANPAVPFDRKAAIASTIATQGGAHPTVVALLGLLGTHDQLGAIQPLARGFRQRLNTHLRIVDANVTTAVPLTGPQADALRQSLAEATGLQVRLTSATDPSLLGGVVAQIGSTVYDGSVLRQLARMRATLAHEA
jgi:F-type H+-transporting ATPase subunit delta